MRRDLRVDCDQAIEASRGYEAEAERFIAARDPRAGVATVRAWAASLPVGGSILDLGCGHGVPVARTLLDEGFSVFGVDASPTLVLEFRRRFPQAQVACESVEESRFFDRTFDGVTAIGLVFLFEKPQQESMLRRAAGVVRPGGSLLFTAPRPACTWTDVLTERSSRSLGAAAYERILANAGLTVTDQPTDEGGNHYYLAIRHP